MIVRVIKIYFISIFRLKKITSKIDHVIFCVETSPEMRRKHVSTFKNCSINQILVVNGNELYYSKLSFTKILKSILWLFSFIISFLFHSFKNNKLSFSWLTQSFYDGLQLIFLDKKVSVCFYLSLSSSSYFTAYFASEILKIKTYFITSNSALYRPMRYTYLPSATIALCSKYQIAEIELIKKNNWIVCNNYELWGLEENVTEREPVQNKKYDIVVFSSAEWARNELYWRELDIDKIKALVPTKLFIYKIFDEIILDAIIEIKNSKPALNVILLPHPYERILMSKHLIEPPYLQKLKDANISFDTEGVNSLNSIFDCKMAVAECSTIITDCWHLNIPAFMFSGKGHEKKFNVDYNVNYLGDYAVYCFDNKQNLKNLILENI